MDDLRRKLFYNSKALMVLFKEITEIIGEKYGLQRIEIMTIGHLEHFGSKDDMDTVSKLSRHMMFPKSMFSNAVENLVRQGYIVRTEDKADRRKVHLSLTDKAKPIIDYVKTVYRQLSARIFDGISKEEQDAFAAVNKKIENNINEFGHEFLKKESKDNA